jgi:hypothetical protein
MPQQVTLQAPPYLREPLVKVGAIHSSKEGDGQEDGRHHSQHLREGQQQQQQQQQQREATGSSSSNCDHSSKSNDSQNTGMHRGNGCTQHPGRTSCDGNAMA